MRTKSPQHSAKSRLKSPEAFWRPVCAGGTELLSGRRAIGSEVAALGLGPAVVSAAGLGLCYARSGLPLRRTRRPGQIGEPDFHPRPGQADGAHDQALCLCANWSCPLPGHFEQPRMSGPCAGDGVLLRGDQGENRIASPNLLPGMTCCLT